MIKKISFILLFIATTSLIQSSQTDSSYPLILKFLCGEEVDPQKIRITKAVRKAMPNIGVNCRLNIYLFYPESTKTDFSNTSPEKVIEMIQASNPILIKSTTGPHYDIKMNDFVIGKISSDHITKEIKSIGLKFLLNSNQTPNFLTQITTYLDQKKFKSGNNGLLALGSHTTIKNIMPLCYEMISARGKVPLQDTELNPSNITENYNLLASLPHPSSRTKVISELTPVSNNNYFDNNDPSKIKITPPDQKKEIPKQLHWLKKISIIALPLAAFIGILLFINRHYSFINLNFQSSQ